MCDLNIRQLMSTHPLDCLEPSDRPLLDLVFDRVDDSMLLEMARADYGDNGATIVLSQSLKSKISSSMRCAQVGSGLIWAGHLQLALQKKGRIRQFGWQLRHPVVKLGSFGAIIRGIRYANAKRLLCNINL
jgi:hypothetical protein